MIINVDRSFLEINSIKKLNRSKSPGPNFKINQVDPPDFQLNKFFYKQIGKKYRWIDRLAWGDKKWIEYVEKRRDDRLIVGKFIQRILNSELHGAFQHWIDVNNQLQKVLDESKAVVGGVGTQSLKKVTEFRHQLENETALILDKVSKLSILELFCSFTKNFLY